MGREGTEVACSPLGLLAYRHLRAPPMHSPSQVDCTTARGKALCQEQSIHAFPSVRIYRGSVRAFEAYEYGREPNVIWLHLVKLTAEVVVSELQVVDCG